MIVRILEPADMGYDTNPVLEHWHQFVDRYQSRFESNFRVIRDPFLRARVSSKSMLNEVVYNTAHMPFKIFGYLIRRTQFSTTQIYW